MQNRKMRITIPEPCHENWDDMLPAEKGRHCSHCSKTVIDFSTMPDADILAYIQQAAGGHFCGRFHTSQLDREITYPIQRRPVITGIYKKIAATLFLLRIATADAWAQATNNAPQTSETPTKSRTKMIALRGCVIDNTTKLPVPEVQVAMAEIEITAVTDKTGTFCLYVPDIYMGQKIRLRANATISPGRIVFFENRDLILDDEASTRDIVIYQYPVEEQRPVRVIHRRPYVEQHSMGGSFAVERAPCVSRMSMFGRIRNWFTPKNRQK